MTFLSDQNIGGHLGPLPRSFFLPKSTDPNFEIAILFRIVENHINYVFGMTHSPTVPGGGAASYKLCPVFTYSIYSITYRLLGSIQTFSGGFFLVWGGVEGRRLCGRIFSWRNIVMGEEKFNEKGAGFSSITIKKTMKI